MTNPTPTSSLSRRDIFHWGINGLGATALLSLLRTDGQAAHSSAPHFEPKVKRAVHICLIGGMSHVDSFDYKPELEKMSGFLSIASDLPCIFSSSGL